MLDIWEQREWHGISRRGPGKADPFGSKTEINTDPGEDQLRKIPARQPFTAEKLPIPAAYFNDLSTCYLLYDKDGAAVSIPYKEDTNAFTFTACFMIPDLRGFDITYFPTIFAAGHTPSSTSWAWGIYLDWNAGTSAWELKAQVRLDPTTYVTVTSAEVLESGAWYWCNVIVDKTVANHYVKIYTAKNGGAESAAVTDTTSGYATFTGTFQVSVGGYGNSRNFFSRGAVAWAGVSQGATIYPWVANINKYVSGLPNDVFFFIYDAKREIQPASIGDTTTGYQWRSIPIRSIVYGTNTSVFNAKGIVSTAGASYKATLPGEKMFKQKTVFMFLYLSNRTEGVELLRSEDSSFVIRDDANDNIEVYWTPADPAAGAVSYGRMQRWRRAGFITSGDITWLAVIVDPTAQDGQDNVEIYKYSGGAWIATGGTTSGVKVGRGIVPPNSNVFFLNKTYHDSSSLFDFRMIVGDDSWATNYTPVTMLSSVIGTLSCWMNADSTSRWPRQDNVADYSFPRKAGYGTVKIALSDRIDGSPRFKLDPNMPLGCFTGTSYLTYGSMPARVTDVFIDAFGAVAGSTDSYYLSGAGAKPKYREIGKGYSQVAAVGSHRYIVGPNPMQLVSDRPAIVGIPAPWTQSWIPTDEATSTLDYKGQLSWGTAYKYKITLYDPKTGTESNPTGPFRFTTDVAPTTTTVVYGTIGCALIINTLLYSSSPLTELRCRYYRFHDGDGTYYLEGDSAIAFLATGATNSGWQFTSQFMFAMTDDELSLQPEIQYDNDPPPWHSACHIWNSRAWYVDALQPSRLFISKENQLGSVPPENLLWTDEGMGGDILGFLPGFNGLLLLRERSIWIVPYFQTADAAYAQPLIPDVGCVSGRSAVFSEGVLWFASPSGLHSFDGQTLTNHSERLGGLDRGVWNHAPELTCAYYNRNDWKVTFTCDGSGLSVDVRSGAVSLCSAPEYCCANISTPTYSGPIYGGDGEIWRETATANNSISLDRNSAISAKAKVQSALSGLMTDITWQWGDGVESGTAFLGWNCSLASGCTSLWLHNSSWSGRTLTLAEGAYEDLFTLPIGYWCSPSSILVRTQQSQSGMSYFYMDIVPMYYEAQDLFISRHRQACIFERLDLFASDENAVSSVTVNAAVYVLASAGYAQLVSDSGTVFKDNVFQLPIRLRGQQAYYRIRTNSAANFPNIRSVGLHFRLTQPRSRM